MGNRSFTLSMKASRSALDGVAMGDWANAATLGVGGEVAVGMAYESMTSIRERVIVAMMGWRLESALMVLKVNLLSSGPGGNVGDSGVPVDMLGTRRKCAGFNTQRAFKAKPWLSVVLNS